MLRWALILLVLPTLLIAQRIQRPTPSEATLACGSEIPWVPSLEAAFERAKATERPVFWYVPTLSGSRMDRKDVVDLHMMAGAFSAPTVATLLGRRFIPVKHAPGRKEARQYGLRFGDFVEPGFLVFAPDGREVFRIDRLSTHHERWFAGLLLGVLRSDPLLDRPSDAVARGREHGLLRHREALLAEGQGDRVLELLAKTGGGEDPSLGWHLWLAKLQVGPPVLSREDFPAPDALLKELDGPYAPERARALVARRLLEEGATQRARETLLPAAARSGEAGSEAGFFLAVCSWIEGDRATADSWWEKTAARTPADRWTRKSAAERQRFGPFSRGFETWLPLPPGSRLAKPRGTTVPRERAEIPMLVQRSLDRLLRHQARAGYWDDSNYDFGGTDSLPNVWASVTALAALALHEWRDRDPATIQPAIDRAFDWLARDENLAWDDKDEIVWAHLYRALFFERIARDDGPRAEEARKHLRRIVKHLAASQTRTGHWRHEYANPFATASVLHALHRAREAGISTGKEIRERGAEALARNRGEDGTFSYGARGGGGSLEGSAGRMPLCELGLLLEGRSSQERLRAALEAGFAQHHHLERVRKVDDHADRWANGGFFFWYDMHGRFEAIRAVEDPKAREAFARRHLDLVLSIPEIDGTFQDSHEIGRIYGTAMALVCLRGLDALAP